MASVRRFALVACLAGLLAATFAACPAAPPPPPKAKNVLLIVADTLRADRMSCYGYPRPTTPFLDTLAARGTLYERCHSNACWTLPSMISMFSGLYVTKNETVLPENVPSLAEVMKKNGFSTAAFVANGVLSNENGFERGFDFFKQQIDESALEIAASFEQWFDEREQAGDSRGFFAWVHFIDPHQPYGPEEEFDVFKDRRPDYDKLYPMWEKLQSKVAMLTGDVRALTFDEALSDMEKLNNWYDGEVRQVDEGARRVIERLRRSGVEQDTLIIFCSDHGEMLFEHPHTPFLVKEQLDMTGGLPGGVKDLVMNGHRPWYYEDLWNTPLMIAGPGVPAGKRVQGLVSNLSIFPTILESCDLSAVPTLQGRSLAYGEDRGDERVFAHGHFTSAVLEPDGRKLIVYPRSWFLLPGDGAKPVQLFDLRADADETRNLAPRRPAEVEDLRAKIDAWKATYDREAVLTHTPEALKMLHQMGYTEQGQ